MKHIVFIIVIAAFCFASCNSNDSKAVAGETSDLTPSLKKQVDPAVQQKFEETIKALKEDGEAIKWLGHYAYLNRQLITAAWLYSIAAQKKPDDYANLNNLGLTLHELFLADPQKKDLLKSAIENLKKAAGLAPDKAAILNNLGYALFQDYKSNNNQASLTQAEENFVKAIKLDKKNAIYYSHLADVYNAQNKTKEAVSALNNAFRLEPLNGVFIQSAGSVPSFASQKDSRGYCDSIHYDCDHNCPYSIIGRIQLVSCEIAQQDAVMACREGKPYAVSYNCDEETPATGFMIPGLFSGFTIMLPGGSKFSVHLQGGGKVEIKFEVSVPGVPGLSFEGGGTYQPGSGMSHTSFGPSLSLDLYKVGPITESLNKWGVGPAEVKVSSDVLKGGKTSVELQAYDTPVMHIH
ncbi:MAG: hypothetical protein C4308_09465 [Chitinophagaceae bacterium]